MSLRIESCSIDAFGPLVNLTLDELDEPVVVLEGHNEAGKTAFFHFLQTMFYGIYPTDSSKHPYTPRTGQSLEGSLDFRLRSGTEYTITRRLLSSPRGQLHDANGGSKRLRNNNVPAVQHVPRTVYESVYALQLDDLVQLEGEAWDEIQDRLLGTLSVDHLKPAREVVAELEDEATDLWRTDNRGKPEAKQLEQRRRELREAARDARERDTEIRQLRDEVAEHTRRIEALKEEQVELRAEQRRAERLVPVRTLLQQIDQFEERAGDLSDYRDLPEAPGALIDELRDEIAELEDQLEAKRAEVQALEDDQAAFTEADEHVLEHAAAIRAWGRRVERHETQKEELAAARREAEEAQRRLEEAAGFLSDPQSEAWAESVRQLSLADLRERIAAYQRAADRLRETQARAETIGLQAQARKSLTPWIVVTTIGVFMAVLALVVSLPVAGVPLAGATVSVIGLLQILAAWRHNRRLDVQQEHLDLEAREEEAERRAENVRVLLTDLPLPAERLERPEDSLYTDLQTLKNALRARDNAEDEVEARAEELETAEDELHSLVTTCGLPDDVADQPVSTVVTALEERLEAAENRRDAATAAEDKLPEARSEIDTLTEELSGRRERRASGKRRLETLGDGDLEAGIEELDARRTAARRAEMSRDRLHSEHPDWEACRDEIEALEEDGWSYTDEERARMEQRLETIEQELREEEKACTEKEKDIEHLLEQRTVGDIESELAHVERRLNEVHEERDRRMLLADLVRKADAEFRRKHQPDVLRRASEYLSTVTNGRYQRLSLDETDNQLLIFEEEDGFSRPVAPPLSQGTLDQVYLSLRLAIIDHLDADGERLPVVLDEVFVNWDPDRRSAGYDLLAGMAEERQIFFFTCHPHFAREAARHLDAEHIDLSTLRAKAVQQQERLFD